MIRRRGAIISSLWYLAALLLPNVRIAVSERFGLATALATVLLPGGVYCMLLYLTRNPLKSILWMFPFTFFAAFQVVLLNLYGSGIIAVDMYLNVASTNAAEVGELFSGLIPALMEVALLYVAPAVIAGVAVSKGGRLMPHFTARMRRYGLVAAVFGVVSLAASSLTAEGCNLSREMFPVNAICNLSKAVGRVSDINEYPLTSKDYRFHARTTHPDSVRETYVFVIGESSRGVNWQLGGYGRPTNPLLSKTERVYFFPKTLSESNTTHKSVPLMLSPVTTESFADSINMVKSFITAFKEAGFHTTFISAQRRNGSYIDYFAGEAHACTYLLDSLGSCHDTDMLPVLKRELARPEAKKLIVLHCYGSHFKYGDRYAASDARFRPDASLEASASCRSNLINAYDNAILEADRLLAGIIGELSASGDVAAMTYTSDHGEDIFDDERGKFLHASPRPTFYQLCVPFVVWMSESYDNVNSRARMSVAANRNKRVSSSESAFTTLVDLAGIECGACRRQYSVARSDYKAPAPLYLNDYNEALPLDDVLSDPLDLIPLDRYLGKQLLRAGHWSEPAPGVASLLNK